jgi:hypothetical protein
MAALLQEDLEGVAARYEPVRRSKPGTAEDEMERAHAVFVREWLADQ